MFSLHAAVQVPTVTIYNRDYEAWTNIATTTTAALDIYHLQKFIRQPFSLEGKVVAWSGSKFFILRDAMGGIEVCHPNNDRPKCGDIVKATGFIYHFGFRNQRVEGVSLEKLGHEDPDPPVQTTPAEVVNGGLQYRIVSLDGVVTDAFRDEIDPNWNWLSIERDGAKILANIFDPKLRRDELDKLVDATISITGVALTEGAGYRKYLAPWVEIPSLASIRIIDPPTSDPFVADEIKSQTEFLRTAIPRYAHRRRLSGHVLASWNGDSLFIKVKNGSRIRVHLKRRQSLQPTGSAVTISGFIRHDVFYERLDNAVVRLDNGEPMPPEKPNAVNPHDILFDKTGEAKIQPQFNGQAISVVGKVVNILSADIWHVRLDVDCNGVTVPVIINGLTPPGLGSLIKVSGICIMETTPNEGNDIINRITGFSIVPRSQSDIRIVKSPPWWTPSRLLTLVGGLVVVIVIFLVWNILLQRVTDRKSRQLLREKVTRLKAELRVDERTSLAVELHDSLAQSLTGVSLQLDAVEMSEDGNDRAKHFSAARNALKSCRENLRYCLRDLRSRSFAEANMSEAISATVLPHIVNAHLSVQFNVPHTRLSESSAHAVLCIIRELAVNAARHGLAKNILVSGEYHNGNIDFSVEDDGCGFDPDTHPGPAQGHFGLLGVKERINTLGGEMKIVSDKENGTNVTMSLPADDQYKELKDRRERA